MTAGTYPCAVEGCTERAERKFCPTHSPGRSSDLHRQINNLRARDKKKGRKFSLTSEHLIKILHETKVCPVFNQPLVRAKTRSGGSDWSPSIDRIDSTKGYTNDNVQVISLLANRMKTSATPEQLRQFAEWVLK